MSGGVPIARQPEVMPVLCCQWTLGGVSFHYQSVMEAGTHFSQTRFRISHRVCGKRAER